MGPVNKPRVAKSRDLQLGISAGVGVNLGKVGWEKAPDMDAILANHKAQVDALNASIAGLEAENAALKDALAKKPKEVVKEVVKTVGEFQTTSASVFFNINKSVIASKKDLVNVRELAEQAKKNNKKILVTGYADSKTGSPAYNKVLSERRAETVKKALIDMGVDAANIETVGQGGVADLTPYSYNRRAVVTLK
jgi:outer membrane protein OmpA-like peptidoglycan-associated protein